MLSRIVIQIFPIPLAFFLFIMSADSRAGSADITTPSQEVMKGRIESGAAGASGSHISKPLNLTPGFKGITVPQPRSHTRNATRYPLACPSAFLKDGVYIWCDPDGVWSISWWARDYFALNAILTTKEPIKVKRSVKVKMTFIETGANQLEIYSITKARGGIVQFSSADDSVQFEILINGVEELNRIYIGSRLHNPKQLPFKLRTRRMLPRTGISGKASVSYQQDSEDLVHNYMTSPTSPKQINVRAEPSPRNSSSDNGGGDTSGTKANK